MLDAKLDEDDERTEDDVVSGEGDEFAGGITEAAGTATHAVRDPSAHGEGMAGVAPTELLVGRSRAPRLADGAAWECPFPQEADDCGIDHAVVSLKVEVATDGHVLGVTVAGDPGNGFAREARRCALGRRWSPGLDRAGRPASTVALVNVQFDR